MPHTNSILLLQGPLLTSEPIHAPGILEDTLPPEKCLGPADPATVEKVVEEGDDKPQDITGIPPINQIINIDDFEVRKPFAYLTLENHSTKCHRPSMGILFLRSGR
jgi:hypothetical protein